MRIFGCYTLENSHYLVKDFITVHCTPIFTPSLSCYVPLSANLGFWILYVGVYEDEQDLVQPL